MLGIDKALYFRVDIDISKLLRRGIYIKVTERQIWIKFKYIKLPDFCYGCGQLGHALAGYDTVQIEEDDPSLQYGSWICTSPLKSRRCNAEIELYEEKRLYSAFSNKATCSKARTKLAFDNGAAKDHDIQSMVAEGSVNMVIDAATIIEPGPEAFKRKLDDGPGATQAVTDLRKLLRRLVQSWSSSQRPKKASLRWNKCFMILGTSTVFSLMPKGKGEG
ncbi:hypothetical protein Cgig2_012428 [Carnegiea gigantea]|uniref:Zinc knuckle CX2CX4HX4C domain-containing protein n=1 Tax=Carnegiea gigantea TaxID=171969 RepID=A0A9Q1KM93_9CARY|nr:hypothetical protein Cgig2_012428 [Carnegiea gigantea]